MVDVSIKVTDASINRLQRLVPDFKRLFYKGMKNATYYTEKKIKESFGSNNKPKVRSGHLKRSIKSNVVKKGNDIEGRISSNLVYSAIQEFGGTIRPVNGQYLRFKIDGGFKSVRQVVILGKSYLRAGVNENIEEIKDILRNTIVEGLNSGV